jgi:hypothetical protein
LKSCWYVSTRVHESDTSVDACVRARSRLQFVLVHTSTHLWGALSAGSHLLPRRGAVRKVAEGLGELQGLVHDALLDLVVADLGVTLLDVSVVTKGSLITPAELNADFQLSSTGS